jgi:uncharacterized protein YfaS (alpha-2-macroglobulin family)
MSQPDGHVHDQLDDFLHDLLGPVQSPIVERHCAACPDCGRALDEARRRLTALKAVPPVEAPPALITATLASLDAHHARFRRWRKRLVWGTAGAFAAATLLLGAITLYYYTLKPSPYDLIVLGQRRLLAATPAALRVRLVDRPNSKPRAGVPVTVALHAPDGRSVELARFTTDANGSGSPRFTLPDWPAGDYELRVRAAVGWGGEVVNRPVRLQRSGKVMLTSDKPVYQPGQVIRLRALSLRRIDLRPVAGESAVFTVADPKGNVIFKHQTATSRFGIASAECELASEIAEGDYAVSCKVGDSESRLTVEVKKYVLPKFKIDFRPDKSFYAPGDKARCTLQADYFFGKPVAAAPVEVEVRTTGAEPKFLHKLTARTDEKGAASLVYGLPPAIPGVEAQSDARLAFVVTVTDSAGQKQAGAVERLVTTRPVRIEVLPEGGKLVQGVSNRLYFLVSHADGTAIPGARLELGGSSGPFPQQRLEADAAGVASWEFIPQGKVAFVIRATGAKGEFLARRHVQLECGSSNFDFLVRTDRAVYRAGETVRVRVLGDGYTPVFIDLLKEGQTQRTEAVSMEKNGGGLTLDLSPELFGTLRLVAYRFTPKGVLRKSRLLYVHPPQGVHIRATLDGKEYRPGRRAMVNIRLTDDQGRPCPGALSLAAVDEAVFALMPQRPGLEREYYALDRELLKPILQMRPWFPDASGEAAKFEQAVFAAASRSSIQARPGGAVAERSPAVQPSMIHSLGGSSYPEKAERAAEECEYKIGLVGRAWVALLVTFAVALYSLLWIFGRRTDKWFAHSIIVPVVCLVAMMSIQLGSAEKPTFRIYREKWVNSAPGSLAVALDNSRSMEESESGERDLTNTDIGMEDATPLNYNLDRIEGFIASGEVDRVQTVVMLRRGEDSPSRKRPARIRRFFPETLLWRPQLITDDDGRITVPIELADSITTWRLVASAVAADGKLGAAQLPLRVFQPFFVDLNLPRTLRRSDRVSVPAVVYNYLDKPQTVTLELAPGRWFERLGERTMRLELKPGEVRSVHFPLRVRQVGDHDLQVTARAGDVADAVRRTIEVVPDGRRVEFAFGGALDRPATVALNVPADAIPGSVKAFAKVYPSSFSQLVEGLDNIFQMPSGCFEQTSSTTYPNVLALDYLERNKLSAPRVRARARRFIHLGYQRLLTFEVQGGGFDWFGRGPGNRTLTAYGLMEFEDMTRVHDVDPQLLARTRDWLLAQRRADGSWEPDGSLESITIQDRLAATAYIAWAVFGGGKAAEQRTATLDYLLAHPPERIADPYVLALVCNALLALDPNGGETAPYLDRLTNLRRTAESGRFTYWQQPAGARTAFHGAGVSGSVETTALAALALLRAGGHAGAAQGALAWLVSRKDASGTWHSTQATVLALKALLAGTGKPLAGDGARRVVVRLGGRVVKTVNLPADQAEVMKQIDLSAYLKPGVQDLTLTETSKTAAVYQVTLRYHVPEDGPTDKVAPFAVAVKYDRVKAKVGEKVGVAVRIENRTKVSAPMVMVELPLPAGCAIEPTDFERLVAAKQIAKFEATSDRILLYRTALAPGKPLEFTYSLRPSLEVDVTVAGPRVWEYYDPQRTVRGPAVRFVTDAPGG